MLDDFTLVMTFIAKTLASIFSILSNVQFGNFSLLTIFLSIVFLRIILWFVGRMLGVTNDTTLLKNNRRK